MGRGRGQRLLKGGERCECSLCKKVKLALRGVSRVFDIALDVCRFPLLWPERQAAHIHGEIETEVSSEQAVLQR